MTEYRKKPLPLRGLSVAFAFLHHTVTFKPDVRFALGFLLNATV